MAGKKNRTGTNNKSVNRLDPDYLIKMRDCAREKPAGIFEMIPIMLYGALVIMIVKEYSCSMPMSQFFWTGDTDSTITADFFSYCKMVFILIISAVVLLYLIFCAVSGKLGIYRSKFYIPIAVYSVFVILSYIFSKYKDFALLGWSERFEGTLPILCYMLMLFYTINIIRSEKNVKWILYAIAASVTLLGILGIMQSVDIDLFRTALGQKMILSDGLIDVKDENFISTEIGRKLSEAGLLTNKYYRVHALVDLAESIGETFITFRMMNGGIYQTIYNPNYVSFYLAMIIPIFAVLFIYLWMDYSKDNMQGLKKDAAPGSKDKTLQAKLIGTGVIYAIIIYNLFCSKSSGGLIGLAAVLVMGAIIFNKCIVKIIKPLAVLIVITALVMFITADKWMGELSTSLGKAENNNTVTGLLQQRYSIKLADGEGEIPAFDEKTQQIIDTAGKKKPDIDYFITGKDYVKTSINGNPLTMKISVNDEGYLDFQALDREDKPVTIENADDFYYLEDERFFDYLTIRFLKDGKKSFLSLYTAGTKWLFKVTSEQIYYTNNFRRDVILDIVPHFGFEKNPEFGTYRGYIWSRTFPLLGKSLIIGGGADTFSDVFPQNDYAGKYTTDFLDNIDMIVDKPHNMYLMAGVDTGVISLLALLALYIGYLAESFKLYFRRNKEGFLCYAGTGIMLGITGFLVAGLVNDSTVSTMPMFYTLLGTGIAVNRMVGKMPEPEAESETPMS